jgi:YbbR domain-containing protein
MENKTAGGRKILYIVISVLIAVGIWVYVDNVEGNKVTIQVNDIPIEFIGENTTLADRGLMLLDDSDSTLSLKLEGTRKVIAKLDPSGIRVQADLTNITVTGNQNVSYKISYPSSEFSSSIQIRSVTPSPVTVDVGELYKKDVEIHCDIKGKVAEGYIAGEVQFQPGTLEIRGQEADIDAVSYAKVTLAIDNAEQTVTRTLDYTLYDKNDQKLDGTGIHATTSQIQVTLPVNVIKELPLTVNFIESAGCSLSNVNYTIEPSSISVSGDAELLKGVDSIVLDDFSLADLNGGTTYNYVVTVPEGCENLSGVTRATMKIAFKDMATATLNATQFECENVPEGKTVTVLTSELNVTLRGTTPDVSAVKGNNLTVVADLKDVSAASGSYTVPATVQVGTDGDVGVVGTYQVKVTISDEAPATEGSTAGGTVTGG